jgi:hypothetical protein
MTREQTAAPSGYLWASSFAAPLSVYLKVKVEGQVLDSAHVRILPVRLSNKTISSFTLKLVFRALHDIAQCVANSSSRIAPSIHGCVYSDLAASGTKQPE